MFADEALASLQQTLRQILQRDHDYLTTPSVKGDVISIHDQASVLQLNLNDFPEKETIREVAITTHKMIEYLFSPENIYESGSRERDLSVSLSYQLREVAEELESTTGDVVDYCRSINNNSSVYKLRQLSESPVVSSTPTIKDEDPTVSRDPTLRLTNRLGKLAEKILSTARDDLVSNVRLDDSLAVSSSSRPAPKLKAGSMAGIAEDLSYSPVFSSSSRPRSDHEDIVGFEKDLIMIIDRLCGRSLDRQVLPVVGMGGSGKTMLVNAVYNDALIIDNFDIRAWVTVSKDYSVANLCHNLLASLRLYAYAIDTLEEFQNKGISDYMLRIYQFLCGRRYLIVMDDIWSTTVLDDVNMVLPDNKNGSWILFTTRLLVVAAARARTDYHMMDLLDEQQSWYLFERKVFADQTCPDELQGVGRKIVKSCGGLPLAIVKVAQLLSGIDRNPKLWEQVAATDGQLGSIFHASYMLLPHHLKECFLYMAAFPEDYEIRVSELIKLWVAEGFLEERPFVSLEETAEDLLKDLVDRSLVLVTSWKMIDDKIRSCRLQNMVRDFCARQAGQERLLLPVMDYLPSPILRRHFLPQVLRKHQRLSVSWCDLDLKDSTHSSWTKSIICIPEKGYRPKGSVRNFRSLRVLHVSRRKDHSYWELELGQVFNLIHLTYLASNIPTGIVPPAISKLQNLQTLIIYRSGVRLPVEIWRMRQLRHLIAFSFDLLPHPEIEDRPLENLQTLSLATNLVCSERMVRMIPNIKKLGICYSGGKFDYDLENLGRMYHLEKLKLERHSRTLFWPSRNPVFPLMLKKLTLSGCRLPWIDMTIVGSLPNLQALKLRDHACDGERWETTEGEFGALRLLLIDESNLQQWITESSHFPRLKRLVLHHCPHLTEIPMEIGEFPSLELIEVDDRNQSLLNSAKMILEEQQLYGNDVLQVRVKRF